MKLDAKIKSKIKQVRAVIGLVYRVDELFDNLESYCVPHKRYKIPAFKQSAIPFFESVKQGKQFTDEELKEHPYYTYLLNNYKPAHRTSDRIKARCLTFMKDKINLFNSIKENGLIVPVDLVVKGKEIFLYDGTRRLVICKLLGHKYITARVYINEAHYNKFPKEKCVPDHTIHGIAMRQHMRHGFRATDKYWAHRYTPLYDKFLNDKRYTFRKVLEIGVQRGASLLLWKSCFPKAHVYGVDRDITKAHMAKHVKGITLLQGLQEDKQFITKVSEHGNFDLIVDDAGHRTIQQKTAFIILWEKLNPGGFYVIEDIYTSYYRDEYNKNGSMVNELKNLVDKLVFGLDVASIHFYYGICFIEKR